MCNQWRRLRPHGRQSRPCKRCKRGHWLTENPGALQRWMISGPEVFCTVKEFESCFLPTLDNDVRHHEQVHGLQLSFAKDVKSLIIAIKELDSPFVEDSPDILVLDTKRACYNGY